jgi:ribose transport system permease protein
LAIGLAHGFLITKLKLQPFVVTLCGLLLYRGLARYVTDDQSQGFGNDFDGLRRIAIGKLQVTGTFALPAPFFFLMVVAILAALFLNRTIWGRYLLALGRNETAARFSGINTDRMKIVAYVICSVLAGLGGILFSLDLNSVQPSGLGEFYELYAIAAAVLGGCSLRGGEGTILGVLIGTAVMRVLYNAINILGIPTHLEFAIIGAVILAGVVTDEVVKRLTARRRAEAVRVGGE